MHLNARLSSMGLLILSLPILLLTLYSRWHALGDFPIFVDEQFLLENMTPAIQQGSIFVGSGVNRMFLAWWTALFGLVGTEQIWVARIATVLFNLLGVAWAMGIGHWLGGRKTAIVAGLILLLLPYELFFGRLLLSDGTVATWALGAIWFTLRYAHIPQLRWAIGVGVALSMAFLAKQTAIFFFILPAIAILPLWGRWRDALRLALVAYGTIALIWVPLLALMASRGYSYLGLVSHFSEFGTTTLFDRILNNMNIWLDHTLHWVSADFLLIAGLSVGILLLWNTRYALFLIALTLIPLAGAWATASVMRSRYTAFVIPMLAIIIALGAAAFYEHLKQYRPTWRFTPYVALLIWMFAFAMPFHYQYHLDATQLNLYHGDYGEYFMNESSGYALNEIARYLDTNASPSEMVYGVIANCAGLRFMMRSPITLICPDIIFDGSAQTTITAELDDLAREWGRDLWLVYEPLSYNQLPPLDASWEPIATYYRPQSDAPVYLYRLR